MWGWGHGALWGWAGAGVMPIFWIAIIAGIVVLVSYVVRHGRQSGKEDSALEILRRRYAKGEIRKEEYEEKRKDLT